MTYNGISGCRVSVNILYYQTPHPLDEGRKFIRKWARGVVIPLSAISSYWLKRLIVLQRTFFHIYKRMILILNAFSETFVAPKGYLFCAKSIRNDGQHMTWSFPRTVNNNNDKNTIRNAIQGNKMLREKKALHGICSVSEDYCPMLTSFSLQQTDMWKRRYQV